MKKVFVGLVILIFATMSISYADTDNTASDEQYFFEVSSEEIEAGETLEMTFDLTQIEWTQVKFSIVSGNDISSIYSDEDDIEINIEETSEDGKYEITFEVDTSALNLDEITLYYVVPDDAETGSAFTLIATITDLEDETNTQTREITVTIIENSSSEDTENNDTESDNLEETNNGAESEQEGNMSFMQNSNDSSSMSQYMTQTDSKSSTQSMTDKTSSSNQSSNIETTLSDSTSMLEEEVTYNGSSNNYLSELAVDGYSLNKDFNKESSTYFVTVSDADSISVTATAEDDGATVCVYGADSLADGTNKILISVTAENGNVRYYRIYVTKN